MKTFNPIPTVPTTGEKYNPAILECETQEEADAYFEILCAHSMSVKGLTREEAEDFERNNIRYYAGYFDDEKMFRAWRLFKTSQG